MPCSRRSRPCSSSRRARRRADVPPAPGGRHAAARLVTIRRTFVSTTGNDANPCTRDMPCRSFGAAITKTTAGGEVITLDSGGYGPVTITGPISLIAAPGVYAGITATSGNAITISAGTSDTVVLRGLTLNGIGGVDGTDVTAVGTLHVEDLTIRKFSSAGIGVETSANAEVLIDDRVATGDTGYGIAFIAVSASLDHVRVEANGYGVYASASAQVTVRDSTAARQDGAAGFLATDAATALNLEDSVATGNGTGLEAESGATIRASNMMITANSTGVFSGGGGTLVSWGNNRLAGNTTAGSFSSTISQL